MPPKIVEVQVEGAAETIGRPGRPLAAGQDRGRPIRDARENIAQRTVERDDHVALVVALAGGEDDGVVADVRPGQPQQVAEPQAGIGGKIQGRRRSRPSRSV